MRRWAVSWCQCVSRQVMFVWLLYPSCMPHHNLTNPDSDSLTQQSLSDGEEQLDRLQQAELTRNTCMSQWRAGAVQAWLEVVMGMPMYTRACSENIKSGKVHFRSWLFALCFGVFFDFSQMEMFRLGSCLKRLNFCSFRCCWSWQMRI